MPTAECITRLVAREGREEWDRAIALLVSVCSCHRTGSCRCIVPPQGVKITFLFSFSFFFFFKLPSLKRIPAAAEQLWILQDKPCCYCITHSGQVYLLIHVDILQKPISILLTAFVLFTQMFSSLLCVSSETRTVVWFAPMFREILKRL